MRKVDRPLSFFFIQRVIYLASRCGIFYMGTKRFLEKKLQNIFQCNRQVDVVILLAINIKERKRIMKDLTEKTLHTEEIFAGKVVRLQVDDVELPNGNRSKREIVKHPGAVAILAITEDNKILMVRQFRKALEKTIYEIPAGKKEPDEEPKKTALRELEEETGYRADELIPIVSFYTSPGFSDEYLHLFLAKGLHKGEAHPDEDEFVEPVAFTLEECHRLIQTGDIDDAKTIAAIYYWEMRLLKGVE